jgi:signal transduction histidine kinase
MESIDYEQRFFKRTTRMHDRLPTFFAPAERATAEEIRRLHADLSRELHFTEMLNAFPTPAVVINRERQIVAYNSTFEKAVPQGAQDALLGLRVGESVGCVNAMDAPGGCGTGKGCRLCGAVIAMLQAQQGETGVQECRINVDNDGDILSLDYRVMTVPLTVRGHDIVIVSLLDISDEKRRRVLEHMFFHDVLNTASGIKSIGELYYLVKAVEHNELINDLNVLSTQLIDEINAHRDLLAAENNEMVANFQQTLAGDMLQHVEALYRYHTLARGRRIHLDIAGALPSFDTDPHILARVLGNLVKNALEASGEGETVTLGCRLKNDRINFTVHNDAHMTEDVRLQVFQRSFSTRGRGRGIGTYSARLLAQRILGGDIAFESEQGKGTTFYVSFPLHVNGDKDMSENSTTGTDNNDQH